MARFMLKFFMFYKINNSAGGEKLEGFQNRLSSEYTKKIKELEKLPLSQPFYPLKSCSWNHEEKYGIFELLKGSRLTMGANVKKFEEEFSAYNKIKYSVMVNSGSSANLIIISSLILCPKYDLNRGDEIIVPAIGWSTSYAPLIQYGLKLKFVDVNSNTWNIDETLVKKAITKKTKAVLAINILGNPSNLYVLKEICESNNIILIEDNCESLGASINQKKAGTFGVAGSNSFHFSHHIQTIEGGMISTNDEQLYHYLLSLRSHGWIRELPYKNFISNKSGNEFEDFFKFVLPGYNLKPNEINGLVGRIQLKKFPKFLLQRNKNARYFNYLFNSSNYCNIQKSIGNSSWFGFGLILKGKLLNKRALVIYELNKNGVQTRPIVTGNILKNPMEKFLNYSIFNKLSNTEIIDTNGLFLGNDHRDLIPQITRVKEVLENIIKKSNL